VKGGGLLKRTNAGKVVTLILSDVHGVVLQRFHTMEKEMGFRHTPSDSKIPLTFNESSLPVAILKAIQEEDEPCEVKDNDGSKDQSERVTNVIIWNNTIALDAAAKFALDALYPYCP